MISLDVDDNGTCLNEERLLANYSVKRHVHDASLFG